MKVKVINKNIQSNYVEELLSYRGVNDPTRFLRRETQMQSPFDLEGIATGIALIEALPVNAFVGIIQDADVDGITSAAIIYQYLMRAKGIKPEILFHLHKGHGLSDMMDQVADKHYDLLIIPDGGSNDCEFAKELPYNILILDHHIVDIAPADNMTIVNNQTSPNYLNKDLSGAGVTWQFCRAMDITNHTNFSDDLIDLAALGCCADMMSALSAENQYLWFEGFHHITNYFFKKLIEKQAYSIAGSSTATFAELQAKITPTAIAFYIVPLINAMIRVGTQEQKERLFLAFIDGAELIPSGKKGAKGTLDERASESARECTNARSLQNKLLDSAIEKSEIKISKYDLCSNQVLFILLDDTDNFPPELNGLLAMKLSALYQRPTIVARENDEGFIRGSMRGVDNSEMESFKVYLESTGLFEYVQGHDGAAGISLRADSLDRFTSVSNQELQQYNFTEQFYNADFERYAYDKDLGALITDIANNSFIWGKHNTEPLIYITNLRITPKDLTVMKNNTAKIMKNGVAFMKFRGDNFIEQIQSMPESTIQIIGKANLNCWNGTVTPQIFIEAYEINPTDPYEF